MDIHDEFESLYEEEILRLEENERLEVSISPFKLDEPISDEEDALFQNSLFEDSLPEFEKDSIQFLTSHEEIFENIPELISDEDNKEIQNQESTISEVKEITEDTLLSVDSNESNSKRGRPKKNLSSSTEVICEIITKKLSQEMIKIEEEFVKSSNSQGSDSRKRDDKPRTKIIRLIKKIPNFLLKLLVSVGDYKHKDPSRLTTSYKTAFEGLVRLIEQVSLGYLLSTVSTGAAADELIRFCGIVFPAPK